MLPLHQQSLIAFNFWIICNRILVYDIRFLKLGKISQ